MNVTHLQRDAVKVFFKASQIGYRSNTNYFLPYPRSKEKSLHYTLEIIFKKMMHDWSTNDVVVNLNLNIFFIYFFSRFSQSYMIS